MARNLQYANQPVLIQFTQFFYQYTYKLLSWWSDSNNFCVTRKGTTTAPLEAVYSAAQKMFAETDANFNGNPPTPIVSIFLIDIQHRPEIDLPRETKGRARFNGKTFLFSRPQPFYLSYQCTIWTDKIGDMDELMTLFYYQSNQGMIWLTFDQDPGIEPKHFHGVGNYMPMYIDSIQDNTEFETGDIQHRLVRKDITLRVEAYLPYPVDEVPLIETLQIGLNAESAITKEDFLTIADQTPFSQEGETITYTEQEDGDNYDVVHNVGTFIFN